MTKNILAALFCLAILASGCKKTTKKTFSFTSWGDYGAISVVTSEASWKDLDTIFQKTIAPPLKGIAGGEPEFILRQANEKTFKGFLLNNYVILFCIHGGNYDKLEGLLPVKVQQKVKDALALKETKSIVLKNVWARPQRVQFIVAPKRDDLVAYLKENADGLRRQLHKLEQETTVVKLIGDPDEKNNFEKSMLKRVGYGVKKPGTFRHSLQKDSFNGISQKFAEKHLGVYMHHEAYTSQEQFELEYIIARRNKVLGTYIEGADRPDSIRTFMSTNTKDVIPHSKVVEIDGNYAIETRGWWTMENDYSAGPFVSYTIHCPSLNKIVTLDGVVFAPGENKMPLLRELELLMNTFNVANSNDEEK